MKITPTFIRILKSAALITSFAGLLTVQGCFHNDDDNPVVINPDQDASGLYKDGTASLDGGATTASDLIGFVHNNRLMVFSVSAQIVIDGTISTPVVKDFTGTVDVYENGLKTQSGIAITGQAKTQSSISVTLAGTGVASGTIDLMFDSLYNRGATFSRLEAAFADPIISRWLGTNYSVEIDPDFNLFVEADGVFTGWDSSEDNCIFDNGVTVIPSAQKNIYQLSFSVSEFLDCAGTGAGFTGLSAVIDGTNGVDTKLILSATNDLHSFFAVLEK